RTAGAHIIVYDVYYFVEPMFQDGPVSVAIADVVNSGASYFTSAGNSNQIISGKDVASYEAPAYRPTVCPPSVLALGDINCHNFNPSGLADNDDSVTLLIGGTIAIDFQWKDRCYGVTNVL